MLLLFHSRLVSSRRYECIMLRSNGWCESTLYYRGVKKRKKKKKKGRMVVVGGIKNKKKKKRLAKIKLIVESKIKKR